MNAILKSSPSQNKQNFWKRLIISLLLAGVLFGFLAAACAWLILNGYLWFNMPPLSRYPIQGLDISAHQGEINWSSVAAEPWSFVYIKATEGGDFKDPAFARNWEQSRRAGLRRGAYHFFTFCRPGLDQARNYIQSVPLESDSLPPVVDLEFGGNCSKRPSTQELLTEVQPFLDALEKHYGKRPVVYATDTFAKTHLAKGELNTYPLWYRDILREPKQIVGRSWLFWQFSNRRRVKGITGFVDANVFAGSPSQFNTWLGQGPSKN